jgi:hypothetical protein
VLVKFSPAGDSPADQRTRDLLVCEQLALQILSPAGLPAARTQVFVGAGRVFLESERFDRTISGANPQASLPGRVGMVSLQVYDAEYVGEMDNWAATAHCMAARKLLNTEDAQTLRLLKAYGVLIANTDRHYGNISLLIKDDDWVLSPTLGSWAQAKALAAQFWQSVAADTRVSEGFRAIAAENLYKISL